MLLTIDGILRVFIPLRAFRAEFGLPGDFNVAAFLPHTHIERRSLIHATNALREIRQTVLDAIPTGVTNMTTWAVEALKLESAFRRALIRHSPTLGLHEREIEYAAVGFGEVCERFVYALLRSHAHQTPPPYFPRVYLDWLDSTVALSSNCYPYLFDGQTWQIQPLRTAYGYAGMLVHTLYGTHFVQDATLSCPAEDFMIELLEEVTRRFAAAITQDEPAELMLMPF